MSDYTALKVRAREFTSFSDDWDGDGAKKIPTLAVLNSINFLNILENEFEGQQPNSIAPSPDGEVMIYWHRRGQVDYLEVNFDGAGTITLCFTDDNDKITLVEEDYGDQIIYSDVWSTLNDKLIGV